MIRPGFGVALAVGLIALQPWRDPSRHTVTFVSVDQGVRLEVLDWGGTGRAVVLLTGSGHTAHVYDDFAPKLTDCCHVYGITRRGYGASSRPESGYDDRRLAEDVFRALDAAKIASPVLIGHSMAGGEMTTLAREHPDRVSGLVYLDAIADLEDDPPANPQWAALQSKVPPDIRPAPVCPPLDRSTFAAFRRTLACGQGWAIPLPESELRNLFEADGDRVGAPKAPGWVGQAIGKGQAFSRDYANIRVPVLVMLEFPALRPTDRRPRNDAERDAVDAFVAIGRSIFNKWIDKIKRHVSDVRVVDLPGAGHFVFLTKEPDVLHEIHAFVASLKTVGHR
jgi:non-heme chloroperoxidase